MEKSPTARPRPLGIVMTAVVIIVLLGVLVLPQVRPPASSPVGTPLLFDDFALSATKAESQPRLGSKSAGTGRSFLIVDVSVANKAKRVDFKFDPSVVTVLTPAGMVLSHDSAAQSTLDGLVTALGTQVKTTLSPGQAETYRLVYDAPADTANVNVQFRFGGAIGTFLDNILIGKRQIQLRVDRG